MCLENSSDKIAPRTIPKTMSIPKSCCAPCPDVEVVQVPGPEGNDGDNGTNGTNGLSASTVTTADFEVPIIGANVTINVGQSTTFITGENVFVQGAGYFLLVSKPTTTTMILQYLNYTGNTHTGETISSGAGVGPSATQGPNATLLPAISNYQLAGSQALSDTPAQLLTLSITLAAAGSYLLMASVRLDFDVATFSGAEDVALKLRETNLGPADVANAVLNLDTGTTTLLSETLAAVALPPVVYTAAAGAVIQLFGSLSDTPYSGSLRAVEGSIVAIPLF